MNKKQFWLIAATTLSLTLSGCASEDLGNEFHKGTDYQFTQNGNVGGVRNVQCTDDGDYIYYQSFVYFYDNKSKKLVPLCNKPNCLHDQEQDVSRIQECNAYVDDMGTGAFSYISYYDGAVYAMEQDLELKEGKATYPTSLVRISEDGSKKETVLSLNDEGDIIDWMIHRGRFYYATKEYNLGESDNTYNRIMLRSLPIGGAMSAEQSEILWETGEDVNGNAFHQLKAYGNYVYFNTINIPMESWNNWADSPSYIFAQYVYDLAAGECREIAVPEGEREGVMISAVNFLGSSLLLSLYDFEGKYQGDSDDTHKMTLYLAELDGTNPQPWLEGVEQGKLVQSTGTRVLISEGGLNRGKNGLMAYEVYDADANLVDRFSVNPNNSEGMVSGFGFDGRMIQILQDKTTWEVESVDLNSIGQFGGATAEPEQLYRGSRNLVLEYEPDFGTVR